MTSVRVGFAPRSSGGGRLVDERVARARRRGRAVLTVRLAGLAGLLAGAFSMAAGELVSVRAQEELIEHEVEVEHEEIADDPRGEEEELAEMYEAQGLPSAEAGTVADIVMSNKDVALDTHVRLELGVDPHDPRPRCRPRSPRFCRSRSVRSFPCFHGCSGVALPRLQRR